MAGRHLSEPFLRAREESSESLPLLLEVPQDREGEEERPAYGLPVRPPDSARTLSRPWGAGSSGYAAPLMVPEGEEEGRALRSPRPPRSPPCERAQTDTPRAPAPPRDEGASVRALVGPALKHMWQRTILKQRGGLKGPEEQQQQQQQWHAHRRRMSCLIVAESGAHAEDLSLEPLLAAPSAPPAPAPWLEPSPSAPRLSRTESLPAIAEAGSSRAPSGPPSPLASPLSARGRLEHAWERPPAAASAPPPPHSEPCSPAASTARVAEALRTLWESTKQQLQARAEDPLGTPEAREGGAGAGAGADEGGSRSPSRAQRALQTLWGALGTGKRRGAGDAAGGGARAQDSPGARAAAALWRSQPGSPEEGWRRGAKEESGSARGGAEPPLQQSPSRTLLSRTGRSRVRRPMRSPRYHSTGTPKGTSRPHAAASPPSFEAAAAPPPAMIVLGYPHRVQVEQGQPVLQQEHVQAGEAFYFPARNLTPIAEGHFYRMFLFYALHAVLVAPLFFTTAYYALPDTPPFLGFQFFCWLLCISAVLGLVHAVWVWQAHAHQQGYQVGVHPLLIFGGLHLCVGLVVLILADPTCQPVALALIVTGWTLCQGVVKLGMALHLRTLTLWPALLPAVLTAVASLVFAFFVLAALPQASTSAATRFRVLATSDTLATAALTSTMVLLTSCTEPLAKGPAATSGGHRLQ